MSELPGLAPHSLGGLESRHQESSEYARDFIEQAMAAEGVDRGKLVLHADNGGPMKDSTLLPPFAAPPRGVFLQPPERER